MKSEDNESDRKSTDISNTLLNKNVESKDVPFRGFEKTPFVSLPRLDITPYLNKMQHSKAAINGKKLRNSIDNSFFNCKINIVREDLNKLKNSWQSEVPRLRKCKICHKVYTDEKKLKNHHDNKHLIVYGPLKPKKSVSFSDEVIVHEFQVYHRCRKCSKIFKEYRKLKTHMRSNHKKRKCYVCDYCQKSFVDRTIFKVHIKLHCEACRKFFPTKTQYVQHRKESCKITKIHKCKMCNLTFYRYMDLKDHSYEHLDNMYVCDFCKEQFRNNCAIAHHIAFLHSEKRPTELFAMRNLGNERLYLCNFCDDSSVEKEIMEKHVEELPDLTNRSMTGYSDCYFCDKCTEKFDKETELIQHKWTHYLKTNTNEYVVNKTTVNVNEVPKNMLPKVTLVRLQNDLIEKLSKNAINNNDINNINGVSKNISLTGKSKTDGHVNGAVLNKKPIIDKVKRKTLFSRHHCEICHRFFSNAYGLRRHIACVHQKLDKLRCADCEEYFVWPSLLLSHKCIRSHIPEETNFDDARPEIHFDNATSEVNVFPETDIDDISISNDYELDCVDFEVPAPIVELTEYDGLVFNNGSLSDNMESVNGQVMPMISLGYKVVMQEVPIEF